MAKTKTLWLSSFLKDYSAFVILAGVLLLAQALTTDFFQILNLSSIMLMSAVLGFLVLGETLVIFTRGFDLSVGNICSMSTVLAAASMKFLPRSLGPTWTIIISMVICLAAGALIGCISGLAVTSLRMPPFIATIGTMWIAWGIGFFILKGVPTAMRVQSFRLIGRLTLEGIPLPLIILVVLYLIFHFFVFKSRFGMYTYAVGSNPYAAYLSGIRVDRTKMIIYILSGLFSAAGGIFLAAWTNTGFPRAAQGYEMLAITAVAIGGVSLFGGKGNLWGPLAGVFILQALDKIIIYRGISPFLSQFFVGLVLLVAIYVSTRSAKQI